jgi:drug/metabolite transporter (DMT)-like permease
MFLLFLMYALFGLTFIFGSIAMQNAAPIFFIGMRMIASGFLMLSYLKVRGITLKVKRCDIVSFLILSIAHIFIPYIGEFWALQFLTAAKVSLIWSLSPFITSIFAWIMFREKTTLLKTLGLAIGFLGFIPIIMHEGASEQNLSSLFNISTADFALIVSVISAAYAWSLFKKTMQKGYSALLINGWAMLWGGMLSMGVSPFFEVWNPFPVKNWPITLGCLVVLVLVGGVVCYNLYGYLLKRYTVTFLSFAGGLVPFFTAFFQWIILGEPVSIAFMISVTVISVGLYIFYKEELRQGYIQ